MATFTPNYNLRKPDGTIGGDLVTVGSDINASMDIIDAELAEHETRLDTIGLGTDINQTATAANGTVSVGTTETRDAVLGDYVFTAVAGRRYKVTYDGIQVNASVANDRFVVNIRNGGAATPTAASTLIAEGAVTPIASGTAGRTTVPVSKTFVPGAGVVTLGAFIVRSTGTGVGTPVGDRELYVTDIGPA